MKIRTEQPPYLTAFLRSGMALGLVCALLILAPFAVAQDVHHELAAADTDGHEHSDNDLCQWVQHHTSGSIDFAPPPFSAWEIIARFDLSPQSAVLCAEPQFCGPSRAPPRS